MLVSLGAAMIVSSAGTGPGDRSRAVQGVATGIGFLCAGDILHRVRDGHDHVKGLTSAGALWVTASLGMAVATRQWLLAFGGALATLATLTLARRFEAPKHADGGTGNKSLPTKQSSP